MRNLARDSKWWPKLPPSFILGGMIHIEEWFHNETCSAHTLL